MTDLIKIAESSALFVRLAALNLRPSEARLARRIVQCATLESTNAGKAGVLASYSLPAIRGSHKSTVASLHRKTAAAGIALLSPTRDSRLTNGWVIGADVRSIAASRS